MVYLKNFTILSREQEERILDSIRETCYTTRYPFNIFRYRDVPQLEPYSMAVTEAVKQHC